MGLAAMRRMLGAPLLAAALGLGSAYALKVSAIGGRLDALLLDAQVQALRSHGPSDERAADGSVTIVGIDGQTLDQTGLPLAMIHQPLAQALSRIADAGARAIAIDLALPDRPIDRWIPGADESLARALADAGRRVPVVCVVEPGADGSLRAPYAPFGAALGPQGWATALLPVDGDGIVRRFDPSLTAPGIPTLAGAVAARIGLGDRAARPGWIDYARGAPFDYVPLLQLAQPAAPGQAARDRARFEGRIVLVGAVLPFVDRVRLPVRLTGWDYPRTAPPAVVVHAQLLRSLTGRGLIHPAPAALDLAATALLVACACLAGLRRRAVALAAAAPVLLAASTWLLDHGLRLQTLLPLTAGLATAAWAGIPEQLRVRRERARLSQAFAGYVSPAVMRAILEGRLGTGRGRREMAFVFADLRGFTPWSESEEPERVFDVLNRYFSLVTPVVHELGGTIDNFRGDGLMMIFGAPDRHPEPCAAAVEAAQRIVVAARAFFRSDPALAQRGLDLAVGVAFGQAVYGDLGSADRRDFTAIGDAVNVAARLQDLSKALDYPVLMTTAVAERLGPRGRGGGGPDGGLHRLGEFVLRGHSPVAVAGWRPAE